MKGISMGIEDFKEAIETSYYVDKSQFIEHAISDEVSIITRPRRFGKTLNMSMLKYFFDIREKDHAYLFDGLKITKNKEIMKYQNQYPVISLTLKNLIFSSFDEQVTKFGVLISTYTSHHQEALILPDGFDHYKEKYQRLINEKANLIELEDSLRFISECLYLHYHKPVMILIDEYDVPLRYAYQNGYYDKMVDFLRSLLGSALKDNDYLFKGVLTGCLRIARESIFTGLNNFSVYSIFDDSTAEDFGFTESEVDKMLNYYHLEDRKDDIRDWYDGYRFGDSDIYNPWSLLNFIDDLLDDPKEKATSYWANSSGNDIVYDYIKNGSDQLREEFNQLVEGKSITKTIVPELTYREMEDIENIYSFLLFTGYLKPIRQVGDDTYELMIPNKEVRKIYEKQFKKWFDKYQHAQGNDLIDALLSSNTAKTEKIIRQVMRYSMSYFDESEKFYHGLLLGMLQNKRIKVTSNREAGEGRYDICIETTDNNDNTGIIIECKMAHSPEQLAEAAQKGLDQIKKKHYDAQLIIDKYSPVLKYGIAFYKKSCEVVMEQ